VLEQHGCDAEEILKLHIVVDVSVNGWQAEIEIRQARRRILYVRGKGGNDGATGDIYRDSFIAVRIHISVT
jgi:hypothetical protein